MNKEVDKEIYDKFFDKAIKFRGLLGIKEKRIKEK